MSKENSTKTVVGIFCSIFLCITFIMLTIHIDAIYVILVSLFSTIFGFLTSSLYEENKQKGE